MPGAVRGVRALPNTETLRRFANGANTRNAWRSSFTECVDELEVADRALLGEEAQRGHDDLADEVGAVALAELRLGPFDELLDERVELRLAELEAATFPGPHLRRITTGAAASFRRCCCPCPRRRGRPASARPACRPPCCRRRCPGRRRRPARCPQTMRVHVAPVVEDAVRVEVRGRLGGEGGARRAGRGAARGLRDDVVVEERLAFRRPAERREPAEIHPRVLRRRRARRPERATSRRAGTSPRRRDERELGDADRVRGSSSPRSPSSAAGSVRSSESRWRRGCRRSRPRS